MRGKRAFLNDFTILDRITPAGAGKTTRGAKEYMVAQDHPRRCGENLGLLPLPLRSVGSPPQVRGKLKTVHDLGTAGGITPAGAGKTNV